MSCRSVLVAVGICLAASACSDGVGTGTRPGPSAGATTAPSTVVPARPPFCADRSEGETVGSIASPELDEISGAVLSRAHPGVLWLHNDSGSRAAVYAASTSGDDLGEVSLPDLPARDWEDIAIGPGPVPGVDYLYIADIGDNQERRDTAQIHRVPEPTLGSVSMSGGETLTFTYPTGPTDAETLIVDPASGDMVIAGKALSGVTPLFGLPGDADWAAPQLADYLGEIELGSFAVLTGGDADRAIIVMRTYDEVFAWQREEARSLAETLLTPPCRIASIRESQGEAIALGEGNVFYTVSEGLNQPIQRFSPAA